MALRMQLAASAREEGPKIPPYGLFYFPNDDTLEPVPTTKITRETTGNVEVGMMVCIKWGVKVIPAKIIGLGDSKDEMEALRKRTVQKGPIKLNKADQKMVLQNKEQRVVKSGNKRKRTHPNANTIPNSNPASPNSSSPPTVPSHGVLGETLPPSPIYPQTVTSSEIFRSTIFTSPNVVFSTTAPSALCTDPANVSVSTTNSRTNINTNAINSSTITTAAELGYIDELLAEQNDSGLTEEQELSVFSTVTSSENVDSFNSSATLPGSLSIDLSSRIPSCSTPAVCINSTTMGYTSSVPPGISSSNIASSQLPDIFSPFNVKQPSSSPYLISQENIEDKLYNLNQQLLIICNNMQDMKKQLQVLSNNVQVIMQSCIMNTGLTPLYSGTTNSSQTNHSINSTQISVPNTQSVHQPPLTSTPTHPQRGSLSFDLESVPLSTNRSLLASQSINPLPLQSQSTYQRPLFANSNHPPSLACQAADNPTNPHIAHDGSSCNSSRVLTTEELQELAMLIKLEKRKDCNLAVKIFKRITSDSERSGFDAKSAIGIDIMNNVRAYYHSIFANSPWPEALAAIKTSLRGDNRSRKRSQMGSC